MVEEQTEYDTIAAISTPPGEGANFNRAFKRGRRIANRHEDV